MIMEFDDFAPQKADETRNPMKPESSDSDLGLERYPSFKINKNPSPKLGEKLNLTTSKL